MKLIAQVKLLPTLEQAAALKRRLEAANAACNFIIQDKIDSHDLIGGIEALRDHACAIDPHASAVACGVVGL